MTADSKQELLIGFAASGDIKSVEALLLEGVDPNGALPSGKTALDVAASEAIKKLLKKHGAK